MPVSSRSKSPPLSPPGGWPTPKSAYIHVPFCRHRCGYCNFSVVAGREDLIDQYLGAIDIELAELNRPEIDTLFIGGGTPTHLSINQLTRLLEIVVKRFSLSIHSEWSVEANPEDITAEKLTLMAEHGVNRLSLGVQSFNSGKLAVLERSHSGDQAQEVVRLSALQIPNVSLDLIFAAPEESFDDWTQDLKAALSLPISHLSAYALTFEKGTSFWTRRTKGELSGVVEKVEVDMYNAVRELTSRAGLEHYEISNFARAGSMCRHNLAYWQGRGWYAAGPGAASFVDGCRNVNHRSPTTYLKRIRNGQSAVAESERISPLQYARERAAFGIRMLTGINLVKLSSETGVDLQQEYSQGIDQLIEQGLVKANGSVLQLSEKGILFADTVAGELLG